MGLRTRTLASALATLALVAVPALVAAPAGSAPPRVTYDALGDSYASGAGVLPYDGPTCARSLEAPARQIDGRMRIRLDDFAACGGAVSADIAEQVSVLDDDTDLVTVSVGGNDIFWTQAVTACILGGEAQCAAAIARSRTAVEQVLPGLLDTAYAQIRAAAPHAHVAVTGYARLFSPEYGDYTVIGSAVVTTAEQQLANEGADLLNAVIRERAEAHGFQFVDVTRRFVDHGVNAPDPWILDLAGAAPFHPNAAGYEAYASALTAALNPRDLR